jgi:cysteine desulfurase
MERNQTPFIYLDHNATTPLAPVVVEAMGPFLHDEYGNPSSSYALGRRAKEKLEQSRVHIADITGCSGDEIVFTSGGSESNNAVLKGLIDFKNPEKSHIITSAVEHPAVLNPLLYLMELGVQVSVLPVDGFGRTDPGSVEKALRPETVLISIMLANNETGTLQPIRDISQIAAQHGIPLHTDAAQAVGKIPVDVNDLGVDFLSIAGHKVYAPKGVGALYIREGRRLTPLIHGAAQEGGRRAGTENMILSVGLGAACRFARETLEEAARETKMLRDRLQTLLFEGLDDLVLNGHPEERLPNTLNVSVPRLEGSRVLDGLPSIFASTGAACHDRSVKLSHVLSAMSVPPDIGMGALRFTLGRTNDMDQIEEAAKLIVQRVRALRRQ